MPEMNYNDLRGRIRDCGLTQKELATRIGISEGQMNRKLAGDFVFRQDEIEKITRLLNIGATEIGRYFFTPKVEKSQHLGRATHVD